jgi:hypothetical protein
MAMIELLLGWLILTALGVGSIVAAEPFWGRRRGRREAVVVRLERPDERSECPTRRAA